MARSLILVLVVILSGVPVFAADDVWKNSFVQFGSESCPIKLKHAGKDVETLLLGPSPCRIAPSSPEALPAIPLSNRYALLVNGALSETADGHLCGRYLTIVSVSEDGLRQGLMMPDSIAICDS